MGSEADEIARQRAEALIGQTIDGRYQIDRVLATGGMGAVYLGRHLKLKKRVAIKVLHAGVNDHPELVTRFEREAYVGAQVSHSNVACATDFGDLEDGTRYLVMEYVRGTHLRDIINRDAPIQVERAVRIARQIAVALTHIHAKGIVHRDLKPRNVMLSDEDYVKLVDFGLAKVDGKRFSLPPNDDMEDDARLTARGVIFGTLEYLAPESAFGMDLVDARADLYALGVILYEMLSGKHPFDGKTDQELFAQQRHSPAPPMETRAPGVRVPGEVELVVRKLLEKDFDERYQTAAEAIAALDLAVPSAKDAPPEPIEGPPSSVAYPLGAPPEEAEIIEESASPLSAPSSPSAPSGRSTPTGAAPTSVRSADAPARKAPPGPPPRRPKAVPKKRALTGYRPIALGLAGLLAAMAIAYVWHSRDGSAEPTASSEGARTIQKTTPTAVPEASDSVVAPTQAVAPVIPSAAPSESDSAAIDSSAPVLVDSAAPSSSAPPIDSAVPVASTGPVVTPQQIQDLRDQLRGAAAHKHWDVLADTTRSLAASTPGAACDKGGATAFHEALVALSREKVAHGDDAWHAVGVAACGTDVLYSLIEAGGKAPYAARATELLRQSDILQKASTPTRIAFALRVAPCPEKIALLDRAVREGDERALIAMDVKVRGCMKNPKSLDVALSRLRARLDADKAHPPTK